MNENQINTIPYIVDFRIGCLPVKKVYVGDKLVWQRLNIKDKNISKNYANFLFYKLNSKFLTSNKQIKTMEINKIELVDIKVLYSDSESNQNEKGINEVLDVVLASSYNENIFNTETICNNVKAIVLEDELSSKNNINDVTQVIRVVLIEEKLLTQFSHKEFCKIIKALLVQNKNKVVLRIKGDCNKIKSVMIKENFKIAFRIFTTVFSKFSLSIFEKIKININLGSIQRVSTTKPTKDAKFFKTRFEGVGEIKEAKKIFDITTPSTFTQSILKNCEPSVAYGEIKENNYDFALVNFPTVILSNEKNSNKIYIDSKAKVGFIPKTENSHLNHSSFINTGSQALIWYPPIGDGNILVDNKTNGKILEIRQARAALLEENVLEVF